MGGTTYSHDDYQARVSQRAAAKAPVFKHTAAVASGRAHGVHPSLSPLGVKLREARDSDAHPVSVPIAVVMDTSGSMKEVPKILEASLSRLMGVFLEDKASGKAYLGDGYPAICIAAVDHIMSMGAQGTLQVGQFESGIEIDNDLENLYLTGQGGDPYHESYELAFFFFARHTEHDHWQKRDRKGYLFVIGDEHPFDQVKPADVATVIGATIESSVPLKTIIAEAQERYHVFFIIPNLSTNYRDSSLRTYWQDLLGENVLMLEDPSKVAEMIAAQVAIFEGAVNVDDLATDAVGDDSVRNALVPVSQAVTGGGSLAKVSADALPATTGTPSAVERV